MADRTKGNYCKMRSICLYCSKPIVGWVKLLAPFRGTHGHPLSICPVCFRRLEVHLMSEILADIDRFAEDYGVRKQDWE